MVCFDLEIEVVFVVRAEGGEWGEDVNVGS
jgi:hypothetical protein